MKIKSKMILLTLLAFMMSSTITLADVIQGQVLDKDTGEPLSLVNVFFAKSRFGTETSLDGTFAVRRPLTGDTLCFRYMGYRDHCLPLDGQIALDQRLIIEMEPAVLVMPPVIIKAARDRQESEIIKIEPGSRIISQSEFYCKPFAGEPDVTRTLQRIPGVLAQNEINAQVSVRGGNPDHDLLLVDNVPVAQPSHLLGIFSSLNTTMVDRITFSPGGFSCRYGNYLGSISKVKTRFNWGAKGGEAMLSFLSSKFFYQTDIGSLHWSLSARRTYLDSFLKLLDKNLPFYFYDLYSKAGWNVNKNLLIQTGLFFTRDKFYNESKTIASYYDGVSDNAAFSYNEKKNYQFPASGFGLWLKCIWLPNRSLIIESTLSHNHSSNFNSNQVDIQYVYGNYAQFQQHYPEILANPRSDSYNKNHFWTDAASLELQYSLNPSHSIRFGGEVRQYAFKYRWRNFDYDTDSDVQLYYDFAELNPDFNFNDKRNYRAFYIESLLQKNRMTVRSGIRIEGTTGSRIVASPRFNLNWDISEPLSLSFACGRYYQTVATARERGVLGFLDLKFPTKPERADHVVSGFSYQFDPSFSISFNVYYKYFRNLLKAVGPAPDFVAVSGRAKGLEYHLEKRWRTGSWELSYTFSKTLRSYYGTTYFPPYDIRQFLATTSSWNIGKKWSFSLSWQFSTGAPFNQEEHLALYRSLYLDPQTGEPIIASGSIQKMALNSGDVRYPLSHRLDIGFYKGLGNRRWSIAPFLQIYNVYNHKNVIAYDSIQKSLVASKGGSKILRNTAYSRTYKWVPFLPTIGLQMRL